MVFCESPLGYAVIRFTRTLEPLKDPSYTPSDVGRRSTSRRESERVHDLGSTSLMLHIFLSSSSDSWNAALVGLEKPKRTYTDVGRRRRNDGLETHIIQVLD